VSHGIGQVVVGLRVVWFERQRLSVMPDRLVKLVLLAMDNPQVVVALRVVGIQAHGLSETGFGLLQPPELRQRYSQIAVYGRLVRPQARELLISDDGLLELPTAKVDTGETRKGIRPVGILPQNPSVKLRGFVALAGPLTLIGQ